MKTSYRIGKSYEDKSGCKGCPYYANYSCIGIMQDKKTRQMWCKCEKEGV